MITIEECHGPTSGLLDVTQTVPEQRLAITCHYSYAASDEEVAKHFLELRGRLKLRDGHAEPVGRNLADERDRHRDRLRLFRS